MNGNLILQSLLYVVVLLAAAWPLIVTTLLIVAVAIILPQSPIASTFKFEALPLAYFPWLVVVLLAYVALAQTVKSIYARRFGWQ